MNRAGHAVSAGIFTAVISAAYALSSGALIFNGDLAPWLTYGIAGTLVAVAVTSFALGTFGAFDVAVAATDSNVAAVLGVMSASLYAQTQAHAPQTSMPTVFFGLAVATLASGGWFLLLGLLRASRFIRLIPYPVIGGFLATCGWLVLTGSFHLVTGMPLTPASLAALPSGPGLVQFLGMLAWTGAIFAMYARTQSAFALPLLLAGGTLAVHAALFLARVPLDVARAQGWLFSAPEHASFYLPGGLRSIELVDWGAIGGHAGDIVAVIVIATLNLMIFETTMELKIHVDADVDRDLRAHGIGNAAGAAFGGMISYMNLNRTLVNKQLGASGRSSSVLVAVASLALAMYGMGLVDFMPRLILAGLLLHAGLRILYEWLIHARRHLSRVEYVTVFAIMFVNVRYGFLSGLIVGLALSSLYFVLRYARLDAIKHTFSGVEYRSALMRSPQEEALLAQHGHAIRIFVLNGFIFFGMVDRLYRAVRDESLQALTVVPDFIVLDFRLVQGIDSSAISGLIKLERAARSAGATLVFSGMNAQVVQTWEFGARNYPEALGIEAHADLDRALEACESELLAKLESGSESTLVEWLGQEFGDHAASARFCGYLSQVRFAAGAVVCRSGDDASTMYFVESGRIAVILGSPEGDGTRLRSLGNRTILGEMGLYRHTTRSASVIAEEDSVLHAFSRDQLERLEREDPALATRFHATIVRILSDRISYQNGLVGALGR